MRVCLKNFFFLLGLLSNINFSYARDLYGGTSEFPPFEFLSEGKIIGSDTEIVKEVLRHMGDNAVIKMAPWARIEYDATGVRHKYDFIYSFTQSEKRDAKYYFSEPISWARDVFFKRKSDHISWEKIADLFKYRLGVSNGYMYAQVLNNEVEKKSFRSIVVESENPELKQLRNLSTKQIDIFCLRYFSVSVYA